MENKIEASTSILKLAEKNCHGLETYEVVKVHGVIGVSEVLRVTWVSEVHGITKVQGGCGGFTGSRGLMGLEYYFQVPNKRVRPNKRVGWLF